MTPNNRFRRPEDAFGEVHKTLGVLGWNTLIVASHEGRFGRRYDLVYFDGSSFRISVWSHKEETLVDDYKEYSPAFVENLRDHFPYQNILDGLSDAIDRRRKHETTSATTSD